MSTIVQPVSAGIVAAIAGFATSFALVIAGLHAVGASDAQASSGLLIACVTTGVSCIFLAWRYRMPISTAWSTPGAALLVAAARDDAHFAASVGAFIVCGVLIVLCGMWPWLGRMVTSIPKPIASAMLAGILFPICLAPVTASIEFPMLALPIVAVWFIMFRLAPRWAVPSAMLVCGIVIALSAGTEWLTAQSVAPQLVLVMPEFDPVVIVSLGLPLFIVTMAGQNVPGFAVMSTFGYQVPPRPALVTTGALSAGGGFFGGLGINLAAITAAIMASPEAHPDRDKRWVATVTAGFCYVLLGLGATVATALVSASPTIIIIAVAGLAVVGALITSVTGALEDPKHRVTAIATFLVTASGLSLFGIGSAFWGLLTGAIFMLWLSWTRRERAVQDAATP
ncbi:MAG TPA: benzoate/H(+) symporter BenE family transporter [Terrimesophilobacter sp.]|nr:benzoate/H(+) symporter BenE family transporter [Terrimesophilobacter sp.]